VALAVEGVLGVRELTSESLDALPPLLGDASRVAISAVAALDRELLLVLETAHLVPESLWPILDIGALE
jgi:chemotaxis signal transduction protein